MHATFRAAAWPFRRVWSHHTTTRRHPVWFAAVVCVVTTSSACAKQVEPEAYGNVEATEVVVAAESAGRLVTYDVTDGQKLAAGAVVGTIDPTELTLQRDQLVAQRAATSSRIAEIGQQAESLEAQRAASAAQAESARRQRDALVAQHDIAKRLYDRTNRLFAEQAATAQQLDQTERDYRVLENQIQAQDEQIKAHERQAAALREQIQAARAQQQTVREQVAAADAQVNQTAERLRKTQIRNPVAGTVLTSYAKAGEFTQSGQPLYKIANLDAVDVRAYVTEPQLARVHLGQEAHVSVDVGSDQRQTLSGKVTWISSQAEFTPTPVQTREERADLVYAIKINVPNHNGLLKIGMPVDVQFQPAAGQ
jgi:HlyD family secretion protein